jgi:siroheme synthase (precorrin-2 oxidase/ferrochelatase)
LTQNKAKFSKKIDLNMRFEKNANFFAKNCPNSQKIVIITSTPDVFLCEKIAQNCIPFNILTNFAHIFLCESKSNPKYVGLL